MSDYAGKKIEDFEFSDLIDWAAATILTDLIAGKLRNGVFIVLTTAIQWSDHQKKKEAKS